MMPKVDDDTFIRLFTERGASGLARVTGQGIRSVHSRRKTLENKLGIKLESPIGPGSVIVANSEHPQRVPIAIDNGIVLIGSDAHIWPGPASPALRGFMLFAKEMRPKAIILNGDVLDFPQISRHDPLGWESWPTVIGEIEQAQEHLHELEKAAPRGCEKIWTLGNHDARFEAALSKRTPEFAKVKGVHLHDHFAIWQRAMSCWINNQVVVKHRFKGGIHATHNNTVWAGKTIVTGHLHSAKVTPFTDYNGTRYGVDTGCLADPDAKAFVNYTEDNAKNWRAAFGVFTFKDGALLPPELAIVWDKNHVAFRGELLHV